MTRQVRFFQVFLMVVAAAGLGAPAWAAEFDEARIFIEYNQTDNDLGFHVFLDGEDWKTLKIVNPAGTTILEVTAKGAFKEFGLTELFFEGAEPSLADVPVEELLELFPEGQYRFIGTTVDGVRLTSRAMLTHAIPNGPIVSTEVEDDEVTIKWKGVTGPAPIVPDEDIEIEGYEVLVGSFQVILPADAREVTLPEQYVDTLEPGVHGGEVLAIEEGGNKTITGFSFFLGGNDD